jgi:hypothetical protein
LRVILWKLNEGRNEVQAIEKRVVILRERAIKFHFPICRQLTVPFAHDR